jgi:hypothetical protein
MNIHGQVAAQVVKMTLHGLGVGKRHQPAVAGAGLRTHRAEEVEGFVRGLPGRSRATTRIAPDAAIAALLSEASFILEPPLDALAGMFGLDGRQVFRELIF